MNPENHPGKRYTLVVEGHLSSDWVDWPCQVEIRQDMDDKDGRAISVLTVTLPDQPALHGLLDKIRDLNLTLLSVNCVYNAG
jgi:hypothetical protein